MVRALAGDSTMTSWRAPPRRARGSVAVAPLVDAVLPLPARLLVDVVRSLPGASVSLELRAAEQDVEIVAGAATFHIRTLRVEDFPPFPEPESDGRVEVPAAAFVATVAKVARSASRDETRPVLTGILVSASSDELRMVATDSYRLSVKDSLLLATWWSRLGHRQATRIRQPA